LTQETKAYADRLAKADLPDRVANPRRTNGSQANTPPGADSKSTTHSGQRNASPSDVQFGDPTGQGKEPEAPATGGDAQKASANQIASAGSPTDISKTFTPPSAHAEPPLNKDTPVPNSTFSRAQPAQLAATDEVGQRLYKAVKDYPQDPAAHLDYQLMLFLQNRRFPVRIGTC
jgi:hypothetical protein